MITENGQSIAGWTALSYDCRWEAMHEDRQKNCSCGLAGF
jgi:hypothetical protein